MQDTYIDQIKHFVKRIKNSIHDEHEIMNYIPLTKILLSMRSNRVIKNKFKNVAFI